MRSASLHLPLHGREPESAKVCRAFETALSGGCALIAVEGVPGSGKTRFLDHCVDEAERRGFIVSAGLPAMSPDSRNSPTQDKSSAHALVTLQERPMVVVIDDAHSCGERTSDTLLARRHDLFGFPVVWLVARRSYTGSRALDALVSSSTGLTERVTLDGLQPSATYQLACDVLNASPSRALMDVFSQAGGHPGFTVELLRGMREEGTIVVDGGEAHLVEDRIPRRLVDQIEALLLGYSDPCRQLLRIASVLGREIDVDDLAPMMEVPPSSLLTILDEAVATGALECGGGNQIRFHNELFWRIIVKSIPAPLQQALREQAAILNGANHSNANTSTLLGTSAESTAVEEAPAGEGTELGFEFSEREQMIIRLVESGLTNRQMSRRLGISPHTVNYHLKKLFRTLGVNSRIALLAAAKQHGRRPVRGGRYP